jgi:hypothetical protein
MEQMLRDNRLTCRLLFGRKETQVPCKVCGSDKQAKFTAEIAVHFSGPNKLEKPHLLVFPQILVCLDCGNAGFMVPEGQLRILANETMPRRGEPETA